MNFNSAAHLAAFSLAVFLPAAAMAEGETYVGLSLDSDYVIWSQRQNDHSPALQGYVEHDFASGLYAGVWFSQVDYEAFGLDDNAEIDVYLGYRGTAGKLRYDLSYYMYYYDDYGYDSSDIVAEFAYSLTDKFALGAKINARQDGVNGGAYYYGPTAEYVVNETTVIDAAFGDNTLDHRTHWNAGIVHRLGDTVSVEGRYYDSSSEKGFLTLGIAFDTTLSNLLGKK
ncbi:TorF family putative porin [Paracoccus litorisediminis]|uniref:Porin n=1 Tax=Paracoccus litorisediminis TaxID=2006130 RepID=A0A844HL28_9RHOB|nr:TorF family putative porin [Paracoccus litorisediminis]MTH59769.1 hypothetical protein [Paracoccus litorisediminis]